MLISLHQGVRSNLEANAVGIVLISVCAACIVFLFWQISALRRCWTSLLVVHGNRCFYVSGYSANDLLGISDPRILDRKGKVFLANGNVVRRVKVSELSAWLLEDELRTTQRNISKPFKICVVRDYTDLAEATEARGALDSRVNGLRLRHRRDFHS